MTVFGGYNTNQLLDHIDFSDPAMHGCTLIGHSDTTVLLLAMVAKGAGTVIHGPSFVTLCAPEPLDYTLKNFASALRGETVCYGSAVEGGGDWLGNQQAATRSRHALEPWRIYREGEAVGALIGGNLQTTVRLAGTQYFRIIREDAVYSLDFVRNQSVAVPQN